MTEILGTLSGSPLPGNVQAELASWSQQGEKLTIYEGFGLLEIGAGEKDRRKVLDDLGALVEDDGLEGFALVRRPDRAFAELEKHHHVPIRVRHRSGSFAACGGRLRDPAGKKAAKTDTPNALKPKKVTIEAEDLVGYRCSGGAVLTALHEALKGQVRTCELVDGALLVVSAEALPKVRAALRKMEPGMCETLAEAWEVAK